MNVYKATTRLRDRLADARRLLTFLTLLGCSAAIFRRELYSDTLVSASPFAPHVFGPLSAAAQLGYLAAALAVFAAVALWTRARLLRVGAAIAGAMAFAAAAVAIDGVAYDVGFWRFPGGEDPAMATVPAYLGQALVFGGIGALLAWRVRRRAGRRALVGFVLGVALAGWVRDHFVAWLWPGLLTFGPRAGSGVADGVAWVFVVALALGVARLVAGRASGDPPRV